MYEFFHSNATRYRLLRTIVQGIIGVLVANIDLIIEPLHFTADYKALIVALVMAILSPIMASINGGETSLDYDGTEYLEGGEGDDPDDTAGSE